eukprot:TRINITY_DN33616_c0_g1_i1.p1 TRINITY_DN33616_c0_g1~~TRINITY_DN33616_c0_g1_i1.p1  ORF type:complete len:217 (-),score=-5.84 TRINITY_DN33616_c0_g1_i1:201-851(-)
MTSFLGKVTINFIKYSFFFLMRQWQYTQVGTVIDTKLVITDVNELYLNQLLVQTGQNLYLLLLVQVLVSYYTCQTLNFKQKYALVLTSYLSSQFLTKNVCKYISCDIHFIVQLLCGSIYIRFNSFSYRNMQIYLTLHTYETYKEYNFALFFFFSLGNMGKTFLAFVFCSKCNTYALRNILDSVKLKIKVLFFDGKQYYLSLGNYSDQFVFGYLYMS